MFSRNFYDKLWGVCAPLFSEFKDEDFLGFSYLTKVTVALLWSVFWWGTFYSVLAGVSYLIILPFEPVAFEKFYSPDLHPRWLVFFILLTGIVSSYRSNPLSVFGKKSPKFSIVRWIVFVGFLLAFSFILFVIEYRIFQSPYDPLRILVKSIFVSFGALALWIFDIYREQRKKDKAKFNAR